MHHGRREPVRWDRSNLLEQHRKQLRESFVAIGPAAA
jgi:hypothetical protein